MSYGKNVSGSQEKIVENMTQVKTSDFVDSDKLWNHLFHTQLKKKILLSHGSLNRTFSYVSHIFQNMILHVAVVDVLTHFGCVQNKQV